jgi:hypothetical protein
MNSDIHVIASCGLSLYLQQDVKDKETVLKLKLYLLTHKQASKH